jgi:hypothetical protein
MKRAFCMLCSSFPRLHHRAAGSHKHKQSNKMPALRRQRRSCEVPCPAPRSRCLGTTKRLRTAKTRAIAREGTIYNSSAKRYLFVFPLFPTFCFKLFKPPFMPIMKQLISRMVFFSLIKASCNLIDRLQNSHLSGWPSHRAWWPQ